MSEVLDMNEALLEQVFDFKQIDDTDRPCEWMTCPQPAEFWLICPLCGAREVQCAEHSRMIRNAPPGVTVVFDLTCNHCVQQRQCLTEPILKN